MFQCECYIEIMWLFVHVFACLCVLTLCARVRICGEFNIVAWKQTIPPVELSFPPITVVLVEHCDHLTLLEGQFVIVLGHIVVHADHLTQGFRTRDMRDTMSTTNKRPFYYFDYYDFITILQILKYPQISKLRIFFFIQTFQTYN